MRALYGFNSTGTAFWDHLADCMHHLELLWCPEYLDVWMETMVRPDEGFNYHAYVIICVDNLMCIHHDAESVFSGIDKYLSSNPVRLVTLTFIWGPS